MKKLFTITSLLALVLALSVASVAGAQEVTPGGDVYVKDFVQGDGNTEPTPTPVATAEVKSNVAGDCESGSGGAQNASGSGENCAPVPAAAADRPADCDSGAAVDPTTGQPCVVATVSSGDLPFTGFEAGIVALAGIALLGAGVGMRRITRNATA